MDVLLLCPCFLLLALYGLALHGTGVQVHAPGSRAGQDKGECESQAAPAALRAVSAHETLFSLGEVDLDFKTVSR